MSHARGPVTPVSNSDTADRVSPEVSAPSSRFVFQKTETPLVWVATATGITKQFHNFQIALWGYATLSL